MVGEINNFRPNKTINNITLSNIPQFTDIKTIFKST